MQIQLTGDAEQLVEQLLAQGRFKSADEAVEYALEFFQDCEPTMESLGAKLREAHDAFVKGDIAPLDADDVKRRGRERLAQAKVTE